MPLGTMASLYIFVGLLGYQYLGDGAAYLELWSDKYFEHSPKTTVANICLFVHVLTAFTINGAATKMLFLDLLLACFSAPCYHTRESVTFIIYFLICSTGARVC